MLKQYSHNQLGSGELKILPSAHIMVFLVLIIHLSRAEENTRPILIFLDCVSVLGQAYIETICQY